MLERKGNGDGQPLLLLSEISFGEQASGLSQNCLYLFHEYDDFMGGDYYCTSNIERK